MLFIDVYIPVFPFSRGEKKKEQEGKDRSFFCLLIHNSVFVHHIQKSQGFHPLQY